MNFSESFALLQRMFPLRWSFEREYRLPSGDASQPYYIGWDPSPRPTGEDWSDAQLDSDGVLKTGSYYNTVRISQYALFHHARWVKTRDRDARRRFLDQATHLVNAQQHDGGYPYPIPLPAYGAESGWLSGMAQGEAASVLLRAYAETGDKTYIEKGRRALGPLRTDVAHGGAAYIRGGDVFFEEVATKAPCHILNGHLFAAFAVWEYGKFGFGDDEFAMLHEKAVDTLRRWIWRYDAGGWSCYHLGADAHGRRHYAPLWYHHFHIAQLRVYGAMTGIDAFRRVADRWDFALSNLRVRARVWRYHAQLIARGASRRITNRPITPFRPLSELRGPQCTSSTSL